MQRGAHGEATGALGFMECGRFPEHWLTDVNDGGEKAQQMRLKYMDKRQQCDVKARPAALVMMWVLTGHRGCAVCIDRMGLPWPPWPLGALYRRGNRCHPKQPRTCAHRPGQASGKLSKTPSSRPWSL